MKEIIRRGRELLDRGEAFALAKVIQTEGSTPRKYGAWLLMEQDGSVMGTVGGGKLEALVERSCFEALESKASGIFEYALTAQEKGGIDMRCGGNARVSISFVDKDHAAALADGSTARSVVTVFGAGHVAKALVPILHSVDFETVVVDDRGEFANNARFPQSRVIESLDHAKILDATEADVDNYVVIVTRGHSYDLNVLREAVKRKVAYVGMIGSRTKVAHTFSILKEEGVSDEALAFVHSPIGLSIQAETPEEIAISITGELIMIRAALAKEKDPK